MTDVRADCRSIVQFQYGEDGIDVMNIAYLQEFGFLARNVDRFAQQLDLRHAIQASKQAGLDKLESSARRVTK